MSSMNLKMRFSELSAPFDNTRDTRYFFESVGHSEALSRLMYMAQDRTMGMGLLTGEIGCGKTLTRTVLANRLDPRQYRVVSLENSLLSFDDILLEIISQIRGERVPTSRFPDRYSRLSEYKRLLINECARQDKHLIVLLDEAQQIDDQGLDALKGLSNISSERANYSTLILVGQPELRERVMALPQVDQRISLRFHINAMAAEEVSRYLVHRLRTAGWCGAVPVTREASSLIARASAGIPRNINRICKLALEHADSSGLDRIDSQVVKLVVDDLMNHSGRSSSIQVFS